MAGEGVIKPKKPKPIQVPAGFDPYPGFTAQPPPAAPTTPEDWYKNIIAADPLYLGDLGAILSESNIERGGAEAAMRQALIRMGGAPALQNIMQLLGGQASGWEGLIDQGTLGAAQAADTAGTSLMAQLQKEHAQRNLAIEDINAAKGIYSSGQTGYELGEERQRDVIARDQAVQNLLDFLRGGISTFAGNEARRERERNEALRLAGERARQYGPPVPEAPPAPTPPPTPPALLEQLVRNSQRPPRGAIGWNEWL